MFTGEFVAQAIVLAGVQAAVALAIAIQIALGSDDSGEMLKASGWFLFSGASSIVSMLWAISLFVIPAGALRFFVEATMLAALGPSLLGLVVGTQTVMRARYRGVATITPLILSAAVIPPLVVLVIMTIRQGF